MNTPSVNIIRQFGALLLLLYNILTEQLKEARIGLADFIEWLADNNGKRFRDHLRKIIGDFTKGVEDSLINLDGKPQMRQGMHRQETLPNEIPGGKINPKDLNVECQPVSNGSPPLSGEEFVAKATKWANDHGEQPLNACASEFYVKRENRVFLPGIETGVDNILFIGTRFMNKGSIQLVVGLKRHEGGWAESLFSLGTMFNATCRVATAKIPVTKES